MTNPLARRSKFVQKVYKRNGPPERCLLSVWLVLNNSTDYRAFQLWLADYPTRRHAWSVLMAEIREMRDNV